MLTIVTKRKLENPNPMNGTAISGASKNGSDMAHQNRGLPLMFNRYNIHGIVWISV